MEVSISCTQQKQVKLTKSYRYFLAIDRPWGYILSRPFEQIVFNQRELRLPQLIRTYELKVCSYISFICVIESIYKVLKESKLPSS